MSELVHVHFYVTDNGETYFGDEFVRADVAPDAVQNLCVSIKRLGLPIRVTRWRRVKEIKAGRQELVPEALEGYVLDLGRGRFLTRRNVDVDAAR